MEETREEELKRLIRMCEMALAIDNGPLRMYEDAALKLDKYKRELKRLQKQEWKW